MASAERRQTVLFTESRWLAASLRHVIIGVNEATAEDRKVEVERLWLPESCEPATFGGITSEVFDKTARDFITGVLAERLEGPNGELTETEREFLRDSSHLAMAASEGNAARITALRVASYTGGAVLLGAESSEGLQIADRTFRALEAL